MQLAEEGFLDANNVKLLGANPLTIHKAEDRQAFKDTMEKSESLVFRQRWLKQSRTPSALPR